MAKYLVILESPAKRKAAKANESIYLAADLIAGEAIRQHLAEETVP